MIIKSLIMIKGSLQSKIQSQVELRKILKYNPTQIYLFGFVAAGWVVILVGGLFIMPLLQSDGSGQQDKIGTRILTLMFNVLLSVVLIKVSYRQKNVHYHVDAVGNILIAK